MAYPNNTSGVLFIWFLPNSDYYTQISNLDFSYATPRVGGVGAFAAVSIQLLLTFRAYEDADYDTLKSLFPVLPVYGALVLISIIHMRSSLRRSDASRRAASMLNERIDRKAK